MAKEEGIIEKINKQKATVRVKRSTACNHCSSRKSCSSTDNQNMIIELRNDLQANPGDPAPQIFEPGASGVGTLWFYSVFGPKYQEDPDGVKLKGGAGSEVVGSLTGDLPYCVPEPVTLVLPGAGGLLLRRRK